jgi:3-(3-hydroxy-phenyl)propionate hydroxylase
VLLEAIEATAPGTVRWGEKATGLEVHDDHVQLVTATRDGHVAVHRGAWLCGADGGKSWVRQQVDIAWEGPDRQESFLTARLEPAAFRALAQRAGGPLAGANYLFLDDDWAMVMELPDHVRVLFHVGDGAAELDRKSTKERAWALLGADEHHLKSTGLYHVQLRLAERFVHQRVVLLGDAAHAGYPVGGTAMNAGILDAAVLVGAFTDPRPGGISSYGETRRLWIRRHLLGETARELNAMEAHWPWTRMFRNRAMARLDESPGAQLAHLLQLSLMVDRIGG